MLERIEKELIETNSEIGESLCILRPDAEGKITVEELEDALCFIQANPKDERIKILLRNLDTGIICDLSSN
jgi:Ca2+-binding EF-hand superfamily protein